MSEAREQIAVFGGVRLTLQKLMADYGVGSILQIIGGILNEQKQEAARKEREANEKKEKTQATKQQPLASKVATDKRKATTPDENELLYPVYRTINSSYLKRNAKWKRAKNLQGEPLPGIIRSSAYRVYKAWLNADVPELRRLMPMKKKEGKKK